MPPSSEDFTQLSATTNTLLSLIDHFSALLATSRSQDSRNTHPGTHNVTPQTVNYPLDVLSTSTTLLRAQTTKLSLLLMNAPFTPSAVRSVLTDVAAKSVPAMMSAWQGCHMETDGRIMCEEVRARVRRVLLELRGLAQEADSIASAQAKTGSSAATGTKGAKKANSTSTAAAPSPQPQKDTVLAKTGQLFSSLDSLTELHKLQLPGLLVQKANAYRALIEDATQELREWRDDADDSGFESDEEDAATPPTTSTAGVDQGSGTTTNGTSIASGVSNLRLDDGGVSLSAAQLFNASHRLPSRRGDLRSLLDAALQILKLTSGLCNAVAKWRFSALSARAPKVAPSPDTNTQNDTSRRRDIESAEAQVRSLGQLSESIDEMAEKFYELDADAVRGCMGRIVEGGFEVTEASLTSEGDKFGAWAKKWSDTVRAVAVEAGIHERDAQIYI